MAPDGMRKAPIAGNAKSIDKHVRPIILLPCGFLALSGEHEKRGQKCNNGGDEDGDSQAARFLVPAGTFGATTPT